jgi:hypothetical protein
MEAEFKRVVFIDERFEFGFSYFGVRPPAVIRLIEFPNYALGYRFTATDRELELIERNQMKNHFALQLHNNFYALTFADLLSEEFIPEVNPSQTELLQIEARVREAAFVWTLFFENLDPED